MTHAPWYEEERKGSIKNQKTCLDRHMLDVAAYSPPSSSSLMSEGPDHTLDGRDTADDYEEDDAVLEMAVLESELEKHLVA